MGKQEREFYRLQLARPLCSSIEIIRIKDNVIESGVAKVCVDDIAGGGLRFVSDLDLLVEERVVFQFQLKILGQNIKTQGNIVRKKELQGGLFEYGVKFTMEDTQVDKLAHTVNKLMLLFKRNPFPESCGFCDQKKLRGCFK